MKIRSFSIQNTMSFRNETKFTFLNDLNIIIGPNGSGKTNFIDIFNTFINSHLILTYTKSSFNKEEKLKSQYLDRFMDLPVHKNPQSPDQEIKIEIEFEKSDIDNIKNIVEKLDKIIEVEKIINETTFSLFENLFGKFPLDFETLSNNSIQHLVYSKHDLTMISEGHTFIDRSIVEAEVNNYDSSGFSKEQVILFSYLKHYEYLKYILEDYNNRVKDEDKIENFPFLVKFFQTSRFSLEEKLDVSTDKKEYSEVYSQIKSSTKSNRTSSDTDYFSLFFLDIYLKYNDMDGFNKDFKVKELKYLITELGDYDFCIKPLTPDEKKTNLGRDYKFIFITNGMEFQFNQLSSGERELLNLIFSVISIDLRNGVLVIDEPELHLHPNWQKKLLNLYNLLSSHRNLQIIMVTHSPVFIDSKNFKGILRIFKENGDSKLIPEDKQEDWYKTLVKDKQLVDILSLSNNSKLYFADKVVLVEGITDEVVFKFILETLNSNNETVEIVNVGSKSKFINYIPFLDYFKIKTFIIGDLDNIWDGSLLANFELIRELRAHIGTVLTQKDETEKENYTKKGILKEQLTRYDVGLRLLQITKNLQVGNHNQEDEDFLNFWINKATDKEKIFNEEFKGTFNKSAFKKFKLENYDKIFSYLAEHYHFVHNTQHYSPKVFILSEGSLENYFPGISHSIKGAMDGLELLKEYMNEGRDDNPKIEELKYIFQNIINS